MNPHLNPSPIEPAMTPDQIQLVRSSFALVAPRADLAALLFYQRLFALDSSLRPLFRTGIEEQGRKLMQMLAGAVKLLDRPQELGPVLESLGRRHVGYGVREEHYDTVGAALLWTLSTALEDEFTPEACAAWSRLYALVATTMKEAAAAVAPPAPSPAARLQPAVATP